MRTRKIILILAIFLILLLSGCSGTASQPQDDKSGISEDMNATSAKDAYYSTFSDFKSTFTVVDEQTENYTIKSSDAHAGFFYEIYDNEQSLLDAGFHDWKGSFEITQTDNIVMLQYGFGGTNVQPLFRFYNVDGGKVSKYYSGPLTYHGETVAYFVRNDDKTAKMIVRNMFDDQIQKQEFSGKFDSKIGMKIESIVFSDDGNQITLRHHEDGNETNIIEEVFVITE